MNRPPRADVLILRRKQARWTVAQLERLPEGVRDSQARYVKTSQSGVYHCRWHSWLPPVTLLSLNELSAAPHNAWVKCFASQLKEKRKAFTVLQPLVTTWKLPTRLIFFLDALRALWFPSLSGGIMKSKLIDEDLTDVGPHWKQIVLQALTIEDMLAYFSPEDVLARFTPKDVVARFKPKDLLAQYKPKDLLAQFKPKDVVAQFQSKGFLSQLKPADLLAHVKPEDIENYLTQLKQSPRATTAKTKTKTKKRGS